MSKKLLVMIFPLLLFFVFSGCSNTSENKRLARVEVYSTNEKKLVNTIEDKEALKAFNENTLFTEQWNDMNDDYMRKQTEIQKKLEEYKPQYIFISYKTPAAINNDGTLEKALEITVYKDTNNIKVQVASDNVKSFSVPSEYLTFCFEASDEVITYLYSLIQ